MVHCDTNLRDVTDRSSGTQARITLTRGNEQRSPRQASNRSGATPERATAEEVHEPPRRGRERDQRSQVRRRAEPSPVGPLHRERGVARGAGDRAQPRALDGAPRARRGNHDDPDAQAALLLARRTAHPLCPALDPAPPAALALGRPVGSRAGAVTGATAPGLTPVTAPAPANADTPAELLGSPASRPVKLRSVDSG